MNETAKLHCGFYSENGGFKISDEDRRYMQTCKIVVSTCAFGGGDDLHQPIGMLEASHEKVSHNAESRCFTFFLSYIGNLYKHLHSTMQVCYVAFWDEITLAAQESQEHRIGEDHFIGKWRVVVVRDLPFADQRLNGKIPKVSKLYPIILLS